MFRLQEKPFLRLLSMAYLLCLVIRLHVMKILPDSLHGMWEGAHQTLLLVVIGGACGPYIRRKISDGVYSHYFHSQG